MGRSYSCNGYVNAILRRSGKTLLVEGVTDKAAMHRLLAESPTRFVQQINIDQVGIIEDEESRNLGNKSKILHLRSKVEPLLASHPKLGELLSTLVDREWDGLELTTQGLGGEWAPPEQAAPHFVTIGHSIENYYLALEPVVAFLKLCFSESLTGELINHLEVNYPKILALAVSFSVYAKENRYIKRCGDLISRSDITFNGDSYHLSQSLLDKLTHRQIISPEEFIEKINIAVNNVWLSSELTTTTKWLIHGHLGSDVVWACVAHSAAQFGVPVDVVEQIERGHQAERERFMFNWLSQSELVADRQPLDNAVQWLTA